jgi:hypothetical protein
MQGIWFTFDAFGQWSEHDRIKMKWRMKVVIDRMGVAHHSFTGPAHTHWRAPMEAV